MESDNNARKDGPIQYRRIRRSNEGTGEADGLDDDGRQRRRECEKKRHQPADCRQPRLDDASSFGDESAGACNGRHERYQFTSSRDQWHNHACASAQLPNRNDDASSLGSHDGRGGFRLGESSYVKRLRVVKFVAKVVKTFGTLGDTKLLTSSATTGEAPRQGNQLPELTRRKFSRLVPGT